MHLLVISNTKCKLAPFNLAHPVHTVYTVHLLYTDVVLQMCYIYRSVSLVY